jgi:hypothetical protein
MKISWDLTKVKNILIEAAPSYKSENSGASREDIESIYPRMDKEGLNRYLVRMFNSKLTEEKDGKLVTTDKGLKYLQKYHEIEQLGKSSKK